MSSLRKYLFVCAAFVILTIIFNVFSRLSEYPAVDYAICYLVLDSLWRSYDRI